jgi:hypothetical protein
MQAFADATMWERQRPCYRYRLAWAQLAAGEQEAFRATCQALYADHRTTADVGRTYQLAAELGGLTPGPAVLRGLGQPAAEAVLASMQRTRRRAIVYTACLVAEHGLPGPELVRLARQNTEGQPTRFDLDLLGTAQYRAGQSAEAIVTLERAVKFDKNGGTNWAKLFLAMACHKEGRPDQAGRWFAQAVLPKNADWHHRLIFDRLRQEAAQLLKRPANR